MAKYDPIPEALAPYFAAQIWREVLPKDMPTVLKDAIISGDVEATEVHRLNFMQAAMEYPHFASLQELVTYFKRSPGTISVWMREIKRKARENRA